MHRATPSRHPFFALEMACFRAIEFLDITTINEFAKFYHHERNHQGLGNRIIDPEDELVAADGIVSCRERLGGLLRYYHRRAA